MKLVLAAIALSLMATSAYAHPHCKCEDNQKCASSSDVVVKEREVERAQRDRVYRGSSVRPERRCFETRVFDREQGIVVSRYVCR